jgi:hypothetical protein
MFLFISFLPSLIAVIVFLSFRKTIAVKYLLYFFAVNILGIIVYLGIGGLLSDGWGYTRI